MIDLTKQSIIRKITYFDMYDCKISEINIFIFKLLSDYLLTYYLEVCMFQICCCESLCVKMISQYLIYLSLTLELTKDSHILNSLSTSLTLTAHCIHTSVIFRSATFVSLALLSCQILILIFFLMCTNTPWISSYRNMAVCHLSSSFPTKY